MLYAVLALMLVLVTSNMATGFDLAVRLNYILALLLLISYVWARSAASQIAAYAERPKGMYSVGDTIEDIIYVRNHGRTPKAWVEVEDNTNIPGVRIRHVATLGILVTFNRLVATGTLTKRGEYSLGPLVVRASDPFALFPQEVEFAGVEKILVYPRILRVPDFASPSIYMIGDNSRRQRANVLSTDVSSVREYAAGDSVSRIHWLSTARIGKLMVKQFDQGSASHVWVLFDQHAATQAGEGIETTDEYGATVAASVVDRYSKSFLPVGYAAYGSESLVTMPERSATLRETILRHIAASTPHGETPLIDVLAELEREFSQSSSLVVITSSGRGPWIEALTGLQRRGVRVNVVLLDRESFGGESNESALNDLVLSGLRTFRIKRGDLITEALVTPLAVGPSRFGHNGTAVHTAIEGVTG